MIKFIASNIVVLTSNNMLMIHRLGDDAQIVRFAGAIGMFEPTLTSELQKVDSGKFR